MMHLSICLMKQDMMKIDCVYVYCMLCGNPWVTFLAFCSPGHRLKASSSQGQKSQFFDFSLSLSLSSFPSNTFSSTPFPLRINQVC